MKYNIIFSKFEIQTRNKPLILKFLPPQIRTYESSIYPQGHTCPPEDPGHQSLPFMKDLYVLTLSQTCAILTQGRWLALALFVSLLGHLCFLASARRNMGMIGHSALTEQVIYFSQGTYMSAGRPKSYLYWKRTYMSAGRPESYLYWKRTYMSAGRPKSYLY